MTRPIVAAVAAMFVCNSAFATDIVNYSAPSAPSAYDWTGFHLGISGGYGFNADDPSYSYKNVPSDVRSLLPNATHLDADGGLIGGTIGFDKQFGQLVLGIEGDIRRRTLVRTRSTMSPVTRASTFHRLSLGLIMRWIGFPQFVVEPA